MGVGVRDWEPALGCAERASVVEGRRPPGDGVGEEPPPSPAGPAVQEASMAGDWKMRVTWAGVWKSVGSFSCAIMGSSQGSHWHAACPSCTLPALGGARTFSPGVPERRSALEGPHQPPSSPSCTQHVMVRVGSFSCEIILMHTALQASLQHVTTPSRRVTLAQRGAALCRPTGPALAPAVAQRAGEPCAHGPKRGERGGSRKQDFEKTGGYWWKESKGGW